MKTRNSLTAVLSTTALIFFLGTTVSQDAFAGHGWRTLVGSWIVDVTPDQPGPAPFRNLGTLNWPGTIVNSDPTFGTGHGTWKRTGRREFEIIFLHLVSPDVGFDPRVTSLTVRGVVTVRGNGDKADGSFVTDFLDSNGDPVFTTSGVAEFTRIKVD